MRKKSRNPFKCMDCKVDTGKINEYYMLIDEVWNKIHSSNKGMLCVGCVEKRLKRILTPADFVDCYLNESGFTARSARLHSRIFPAAIK